MAAKKEKVAEFNGTVFKAMLKEPTTAMKALETFISTAKKLPSTELYDVVEGFIKISMECVEIFKLLEGEKQTESELLLIFQSLEMILLRTASDLSPLQYELLPEILSTGLKEDRMSIVNLILSTLKSRTGKHHPASVLVGLKQATEDKLVAELVVNMLKASPDVLSRYFKETQHSYTPRLKSAWQDNVSLLKKMANTGVQLTTLSTLNFLLKKASKNMEYLLGHSSDGYTPEMMGDLVQQYKETLSKILPDMTGIVSMWQLLTKKEKTEGEGKKTKHGESGEHTDGNVPDTAEVIVLKALLLRIICLYQKVVPHLVSQSKFDFSKLLKGVVSEKGLRQEVAPVLQQQILQLALDLPASKFSWFHLQDARDSDSSSGEKSVLYLLLKMFVTCSSSHLKASTRMLVLKVLKDSGVFEYTWKELELWLDQLDSVNPNQQETVIQFLERREPLPLCLGLLQYDKELVSSCSSPHPSIIHLHQYYSLWLPPQCQEELFKSSECLSRKTPSSFSERMKAAYSEGLSSLLDDTFRKDVEETLTLMSLADFPLVIKQTLLYLKSAVETFGTFSKDTRNAILKTLMEVLLKLVTKLQGFQILISALGSIFNHPCLEQWYLALELATFPPHSLNPVKLKHLCAQLSDGITALLQASAPTLCDLGHSELLLPYMGAIEKAVALQVMEMSPLATKKQSRPLQALVSLHSFMDSSNVREVVSKLLLLPQDSLICPGSDGAQSELTVYGQAALQILTESNANPSKGRDVFLSHAHLHGLGTLLLFCSSPALDTFLLKTLSNEPGSARLIHTDVLLHCLQHPRLDTLAISSLLLQNCSTHRLFFEVWCLEPANMEKLSERSETFLPLIGNYLQLVDVITEKLSDFPEEQESWKKSVTTAALKFLTASYSCFKDPATIPSAQEQSILERLQSLLTSSEEVTASDWNTFIKNGLKCRYRDHCFLNSLKTLLEVMYGGAEIQKDLIPLSTLHTMTSSHSLFLPTMLDSDEERSKCEAKECVVDCLKFVSVHALGVTLMALSSYDPKLRAAAYHVLSCFYQHLEGTRCREKKQLLYLMDMTKNGIRQPNQRLPFVLTTYVSKVAQQMLKPEDHMYVVLNRFLLSHQSLDFRRVPEFFKLFYGFDLEHKMEREWILSVLQEGINDGHCYELCNQQGIFQSLLGFSSSPLCDEHSQTQILQVLCQAARVPKAAYGLTKSAGLLSWIPQMIDKRLGVKATQLKLFLQTLCSVLMHRHAALGVNEQAGRLTLKPPPLSCTEALTLLLCWASLSRNATLLTQIQALADKYKVKDFVGTRKDRGKGSFSQARTRKEGLAEDAETEKQEESLLTECKFSLSSIFVHWEPVFPLNDPQPGERVDCSGFAVDTAHLLTKWSLRCLVEDAYDEKRTESFLRWLDTTVIKHKQIVALVFKDPAVNADLLRLYHRAFETDCHASISRRETFQFQQIHSCLSPVPQLCLRCPQLASSADTLAAVAQLFQTPHGQEISQEKKIQIYIPLKEVKASSIWFPF
ncbi:unnamed protein product [Lampetra planeri]